MLDPQTLDHLAHDYAEPSIVILTALAAIFGAMLATYKKVIKPTIITIDALNELVAYHLQSNGGKSLLDKVNKLERNISTTSVSEAKFHKEVLERLARVETAMCPLVTSSEEVEE